MQKLILNLVAQWATVWCWCMDFLLILFWIIYFHLLTKNVQHILFICFLPFETRTKETVRNERWVLWVKEQNFYFLMIVDWTVALYTSCFYTQPQFLYFALKIVLFKCELLLKMIRRKRLCKMSFFRLNGRRREIHTRIGNGVGDGDKPLA